MSKDFAEHWLNIVLLGQMWKAFNKQVKK